MMTNLVDTPWNKRGGIGKKGKAGFDCGGWLVAEEDGRGR